MRQIFTVLFVCLTSLIPSCSVYMEATRPTPVDLDEYQVGQSRDSVLERLGSPTGSAKEGDGADCDFYQLYTKGYGAGGKIPISIAEGAADFFTLGLAEVVLTPTEGVTKNEKHPVAFCYKDAKIVRVNSDGGSSSATVTPVTAADVPVPAQSPQAPAASTPAAAVTKPTSAVATDPK